MKRLPTLDSYPDSHDFKDLPAVIQSLFTIVRKIGR